MPQTKNQIGRTLHACGRFLWLRWNQFVSPLPNSLFGEEFGTQGELTAAKFLQSKGHRILEHSYRIPQGEIDLITLDGERIVFVEVKTWRSADHGDPSQAVDSKKQQRITRAALHYLKRKKLLDHPSRFDMVSIVANDASTTPTIRHFVSAFEAVGGGQLHS